MTSSDPSEQHFPHRRRMSAPASRASLLDSGARLLALAAAGYILIRLAVPILHLS